MTDRLISEYKKKKRYIRKRLKEFEEVWLRTDRKIFSELCFCICTPQSKAVYCDKAVSGLEKSGALFTGNARSIRSGLKAVRFPNNKAGFIVESRKLFTEGGKLRIKNKIDASDIIGTRHWLVRNVKGLGYKEASHFLRNIGFGKELAILDVHILKNLIKCGIIKEVPKSITESVYLKLEEKVRKFSKKVKIPMAELDLLFWSSETGEIFK
ncbi:N-glycosylase/DNA lyase [Candidatus Omnitrophota bacterium]